jgi:hypothetical protein
MILIIADKRDVHVPYVAKKLESRGAHYLIFDPQHFPATAEISIHYDRLGTAHRTLNYKREELDLSRVRAVWNRAAVRPMADAKVKEEQLWWVSEGSSRLSTSFQKTLYDVVLLLKELPRQRSLAESARTRFKRFEKAHRGVRCNLWSCLPDKL